jgi:N-acetylmuramoyl-L-alanine amidase
MCLKGLFVIALLFSTNLFAQKKDSIIQYLNNKALKYLIRDEELKNYFTINSNGVFIYRNVADKKNNKYEFYVPIEKIDSVASIINTNYKFFDECYNLSLKNRSNIKAPDTLIKKINSKGLTGKRIAIDPGHISNGLSDAKIEGKCVKFKADSANDRAIIEGQLTYAVAYLLKEKLEKEGAVVFLTRQGYGKSSLNQTFNDWLTSDSSGYAYKQLNDKELKKVFLLYNNRDIVNRCQLINNFNPDVTVIIHFNVDEKNLKWEKPTTKNYNMIFVPGAMSKGDLNIQKNRKEFVRLLLTNHWEESVKVSGFVINSFEQLLGVPTALPNDADYLTQKSLQTPVKGVYARNLALCRLVHSPLLYGETLYQDNEQEYIRLTNKNIEVQGEIVSDRLLEVANAYFEGIKAYFNN